MHVVKQGSVMAAVGIFVLLFTAFLCLRRRDGSRRWRERAARVRRGPADASKGPNFEHHAEAAGDLGVEDVPLLLELLGAVLDAGLSIPWALRIVSGVASAQIHTGLSQVVAGLEMGASWEHSWAGVGGVPQLAALHSALGFAALTGSPAAPLLYAEARQRRRQSNRDAEKRAAALGVKLVIPLGLCSLPAFICLGIVPVVVAMIPAF
ncbi:type II secretion system F family protein [Arthrobacter sp. AQ5-05]|uniref:type II secretion system F family protein n=1 Tax=Arthrobacter sp. AQ5-05 TaxID=2184581 RepID=UPI001E3F074A|nr:type II secretion system F family protein [Arthrobacter sp. AQ5-05]